MKKYFMAFALLWSLCACADAQPPRQLTLDGVAVDLELADSDFRVGSQAITRWIQRSLGIVAAYYGQFPTRTLHIHVVPVSGAGVRTGKTFGYRGGFIRVEVGRDVTEAQLMNDWVLVHEMTHLALPDVGEDHSWLSEGLAVYIEGIARVQAGNRTQEDVFSEELHSMPRGLPQPGDEGLDNTHTWGRTYWGGAMFCLLADVQIHEHTNNRLGLQDAMRAVARQSGGLSADWPIGRVFAIGDAATGTTVLADLYARMKDAPVDPDLPALWSKLGVQIENGTIKLSDAAPLADIRRSIMQPRGNKTSS